MGDCELCGAMNVGLREVDVAGSKVGACRRCIEKMGIKVEQRPPPRAFGVPGAAGAGAAAAPGRGRLTRAAGGYGGQGRQGRDIMVRGEKELAEDFGRRIVDAREARGWDQRGLARRLAERVNIIQQAEQGKRPTDAVIKKLERELDIELMVDAEPTLARQVPNADRRLDGAGMTLGDYLKDV